MPDVDIESEAGYEAARQETNDEPRTVTLKGETFELGPAELPLFFGEYLRKDQLTEALGTVFDAAQVRRIAALAPSLTEGIEFLGAISVAYGVRGGLPESSASNGSSQNGSRRSRRTSNASTP